MEASTFIKNYEHFIALDEVRKQLFDAAGTDTFWQTSYNRYFFPSIKDKNTGIEYIPQEDLPFYLRLAKLNSTTPANSAAKFENAPDLLSVFLRISEDTALYITDYSASRTIPAFVRNLIYYPVWVSQPAQKDEIPSRFDLMDVTVITYERQIKDYMELVVTRKKATDRIRHSNFTNTASYMGNKKRIAGYIVETLFPHISNDTSFIDLMCGSGAMSQAFAQLGMTYASDAQDFCQLLAKIQGHGFTKMQAVKMLEKINGYYQKNYQTLADRYQTYLTQEADLYRRDWSNKSDIYSLYSNYAKGFTLYSSTNPVSERLNTFVNEYKQNHKKYPYCLFTLYFSNVYFGLNQCLQLDSIRYAVDQFSGDERDWALGVLVVTVYQISSGHANHFAQPKKISEKNIIEVLIKRQKSAYHEFSKRLLCLAEESEVTANEIRLLPGPWQKALDEVNEAIPGNKIVYLDAPYKRDEYSRYYHVLETTVKYDYPSSELKGRIRSKRLNERFATEFFTKNEKKIENVLAEIISTVVSSGMKCAWSYSDNGDASILRVLENVIKIVPCRIFLYGTSHSHQSQRGANHNIPVTEYCIVFCPADTASA